MRLFVAIELSDSAQAFLGKVPDELKVEQAKVRWMKPEYLHLTLKFLGEVEDGRYNEIVSATARAAAASAPFVMKIENSGCFPPRGAARILWAGVSEPLESLAALAASTEREFEKLGFRPENRPYKPHITLARVKNDSSRGALREAIQAVQYEAVTQAVDAISIYRSHLSSSGSHYEVLERLPLS